MGVTSFGLLFLFLGVATFFDAALLALGDVRLAGSSCLHEGVIEHPLTLQPFALRHSQILFLSGITLVIGPRKVR